MEPRRVTQLDVARRAGVHRATVSMALRNHPNIPPATRDRILKIAATLGYSPDPMLSALAAYRSRQRGPTFHGTLAWLANSAFGFDWRDRRVRPWLLAGFFGGQAQAMMLGVIGFLILDRLHLRLRPDEGAAITGIVLMAGAFATLLSQWGLIPLLKMTPRTTVLYGAAFGGVGILMTGLAQDLHAIVIGFALASLGFGLFRPGFTAGASLSVPRRDQGSVAGMTASINGSAYIISPAIGVLLYNWHPMISYGLMAAFCGWLVLWGWSALRQDQPTN